MNNGNEFWPEDTATKIYIPGDCDMETILERIQAKWPGTNLSNITIEPDYIHTTCLGYDLYDPSDYTNFLIIKWRG